jgi:hypothetical protein
MSRHEAAATFVGVATTTLTVAVFGALPTTTTHQVLGDQRFEMLSARGAALEPAELVRYALEQIEQLRTMV